MEQVEERCEPVEEHAGDLRPMMSKIALERFGQALKIGLEGRGALVADAHDEGGEAALHVVLVVVTRPFVGATASLVITSAARVAPAPTVG